MDLLETIKRIRGSEESLGLTFGGAKKEPDLPDGSKLLGYTNRLFFCTIEGYLGTVFVVDPESEHYAVPIAYNFADFIRLIFACGSAQAAVAAIYYSPESFKMVLNSEAKFPHADLDQLATALDLMPIQAPYRYVQTVRSVIDCGRIARKPERKNGYGKKIDQRE